MELNSTNTKAEKIVVNMVNAFQLSTISHATALRATKEKDVKQVGLDKRAAVI